jgi:hypothetical protein
MSRSERIVQQLGMSQGAASGRLKKILLFQFLVRLKENFCFRCKAEIVSVEDLSVEHKEPWEGISADLFWDLNNIAYSHLKCNVICKRPGTGISFRKVGPEGTAWCWKCDKFLSVENFSANKFRWNNLNALCKEHQHYLRK